MRDAENATIQNNRFGAVTIAGVSYPRNAGGVAITATDFGETNRPNLSNIDIGHNILNGETVKGCELPNPVVACAGDTPCGKNFVGFWNKLKCPECPSAGVACAYKPLYIEICWDNWLREEGLSGWCALNANKV